MQSLPINRSLVASRISSLSIPVCTGRPRIVAFLLPQLLTVTFGTDPPFSTSPRIGFWLGAADE